jgi:hypothetical protein
MNLGDFNTDFTVTVVHFDDTTSNVSVNFRVKCNINDRVSIHTTVVDTTELSSGYTDYDVVAEAWENIKTTVNQWASFNILNEPLSELTITSTSNAIDVSTFNTHFTVKVIRFELLPTTDPNYWSIYYSVTSKVKQDISTFFEGLVPLTQEFCNNTLCSNIVTEGWELIKNDACHWASANIPTGSVVLDTIYTPTSI